MKIHPSLRLALSIARLAADDKSIFMKIEDLFGQDPKTVFMRLEDLVKDDPEAKKAVEDLQRLVGGGQGQGEKVASESVAVEGWMDAEQLIKAMEGALRAGKLTPEQQAAMKRALAEMKAAQPQQSEEKKIASIAARVARVRR